MAYLDLARLAARTHEALGNGVAIVILSDHGMGPSDDEVTRDYTPYGFWSINGEWDWLQSRKATDFFNLFLRILREEQSSTRLLADILVAWSLAPPCL